MNKTHLFTPDLNKEYPVIVKTEGVTLTDSDGKTYLDMSATPFANSLGFGRKDLAKAISDQAELVHSAYRKFFISDIAKKAADLLAEQTGMDRFILLSGGTEANESAVKIARAYHLARNNKEKNLVLGRWQSYHGGTMYVMGMAADPEHRARYMDVIPEIGHVPPCYCYRCWYDEKPETCNLSCANALEDLILSVGSEKVSAYICETISGSSLGGAKPLNMNYFKRIQEICRKYDVLLILDEILVGCGRTGKFCAYEHYGIKPDMVTLGKCISAQYIGSAAVGCTEEIAQTISDNCSGICMPVMYTVANQPMTSAAIVKTLEIYKEENLVERNNEIGKYMCEKFKEMATRHPTIGDIRGTGSLVGVEFVKNRETKELLPKELQFASTLSDVAFNHGVAVLHFGQLTYEQIANNELIGNRFSSFGIEKMCVGDRVLFAPPYVITWEDLDDALKRYEDALYEVERKFNLI